MLAFVCLLLTLALAVPASTASTEVVFRTVDVDFGDTTDTVVTGRLPDKTLVGAYRDAFGNLHGFWRYESSGVILPLLGHIVQDVSLAGATGWFRAPAATPTGLIFTWGFIYFDGSVQILTGPQTPRRPAPTLVEPISINDASQVCGDYRSGEDGVFRGFLYDPTPRTYTVIEVPDALSTACLHVTQDGRLLVRSLAADGTTAHWVWEAGTFTPLTIPDLPNGDLVAFRDGIIVGNVGHVGVVWDGTTLTEIDVPGSTLTELAGLQVEGDTVRVFGRYIAEGVNHGFVATIAPSPSKQGQAKARAWRRSAKMQAQVTQEHCWAGSTRAVCRGR